MGTIAGAVIGGIIFIVFIVVVVLFCIKAKKKQGKVVRPQDNATATTVIVRDGTYISAFVTVESSKSTCYFNPKCLKRRRLSSAEYNLSKDDKRRNR